MKGNRIVTLFIIASVFTALMEVEMRLVNASRKVYDRFLSEKVFEKDQIDPIKDPVEVPLVTALHTD